jgi:hypothetical protein
MKFSHKLSCFLTAIPFSLFLLYSQSDYNKLYKENINQKKEIEKLKSDSPDSIKKEAMKLYDEAFKELQSAKKYRVESEEVYQVAQRNSEYRNNLLQELKSKTEAARKYMNAFHARKNYFEVELFMSAIPKKNNELGEVIEKVKQLPISTLALDIEMKKALEEAMTVYKYIKNNL